MGIIFLQLLLALTSTVLTFKTPQLQIAYQWNELEFEFPSEADMVYAMNNGLYVPGNAVPIDVDLEYRSNGSCRTFVTVPRFTTGIPVTLATVEKGPMGPVLKPYPDYSWHSSHGMNCNGITSVFRIFIDECNRLWVLDSGRIGSVQFCPPQLLVFDLRSDTLIRRYRFPQSQYKTGVSLFVTPVVDVRDPPPRGNCMNTFVYIADVTGFGLVVYDLSKDTSWRIENKLFYPNPDFGTFTVAGESFDLMDGILALAITPRTIRGERYLFFHSLASDKENAVPLRVLDNQSLWEENMEASPRSFMEIGSRNIQSVAEAMDSRGNLFFGLLDPIAIASWNINRPYRPENIMIVSRNQQTLQFPSGIKIKKNKNNQEELWVLTNRFQKVMTETRNSNEVNFRIQGCLVDDLLNNRPCSPIKQDDDGIILRGGNHNENTIYP